MTKPVWSHILALSAWTLKIAHIFNKVKSCYYPLRLGTVIVLVSSGRDFVNTQHLYGDRATRLREIADLVCARASPECLDFTINTPQPKQLCLR